MMQTEDIANNNETAARSPPTAKGLNSVLDDDKVEVYTSHPVYT